MSASGTRPRVFVTLLLVPVVAAGCGVAPAAAAPPRAAPDPLPSMLADDWSEQTRAAVAERMRALGGAACATLSGYAAAPDPRSREHAVRALQDAGCERVEDYRPFFADRAPWVVDAVVAAAAARRISAAWPFVLAHVDDRRRLVSDGGSWTLEEAAHRALRRLTAQPIPFDARDPPAARDRAAAAWRAWFATHGGEPPAAWIESGLQAARAALSGSDERRRIAALETLALAAERGQGLLRDALLRASGEIEATLVCEPDEPPRVTDTVPCTLTLRNATARRIPMALGEEAIGLAVVPAPAAVPPPPAPPSRKGAARKPAAAPDEVKRRDGPGAAASTAVSDPVPAADDARWRFVDLAPGTTTVRSLRAGPVGSAGRYEVRVAVPDLGAELSGSGAGRIDPIEAAIVLRFEQ